LEIRAISLEAFDVLASRVFLKQEQVSTSVEV